MKWLDASRPFDAGRFSHASGLFNGWVILAAAVLGALASVPGQTTRVSVFADPLIAATGLSRLGLAGAYLVGTVTSGLLLPGGGRLLNHYGERATAIGACIGLGLTLALLSQIDRAAATIAAALSTDPTLTAFMVVAVGFVLLRFSGQGMLTLASRNLVGQWFDARRGLAAGLFSVLMSLGMSVAPVLLNAWIVAAGGWREAWLGLGLTVGVAMAVVAWVFYRDTPEQCGLQPDGVTLFRSAFKPISRREYTRAQAMATKPFWAVALALFPPTAVVGVIVGLAAGMASDRFRLRWIVIAMALAETAGYLGVAQLGEPLFFALAAAGLGTATGFMSTLQTVSMPKLYGRRHLGATSSAQMSILVIASALGPVGLAWAHSLTGSYTPALVIASGRRWS